MPIRKYPPIDTPLLAKVVQRLQEWASRSQSFSWVDGFDTCEVDLEDYP